jgi:hypothetical protein
VNLFILLDVRSIHPILIDGDGPHIVAIGMRRADAMQFRRKAGFDPFFLGLIHVALLGSSNER